MTLRVSCSCPCDRRGRKRKRNKLKHYIKAFCFPNLWSVFEVEGCLKQAFKFLAIPSHNFFFSATLLQLSGVLVIYFFFFVHEDCFQVVCNPTTTTGLQFPHLLCLRTIHLICYCLLRCLFYPNLNVNNNPIFKLEDIQAILKYLDCTRGFIILEQHNGFFFKKQQCSLQQS